jgi:hypothetical protein
MRNEKAELLGLKYSYIKNGLDRRVRTDLPKCWAENTRTVDTPLLGRFCRGSCRSYAHLGMTLQDNSGVDPQLACSVAF